MTLEDATTKDTAGDWQVQEPTALSYDISSNALVRSGDTITSTVQGQDFASIEDIYEASTPVRFQIANASGANNRTLGKTVCSGKGKLVNLSATGTDRQKATYSGTLNMYGPVTVGND
jgi:hypothetical protein